MNFENPKSLRVGAAALALTALISTSGCGDKNTEATGENINTPKFSVTDSVVKSQAPTETVTPTQNPTATEAPTVNPTQNPTATEAPTPTQVIETPAPTDNLKIPEGLSQEDYDLRLAIKGAFQLNGNISFSLDENEVKQYIATGETINFNTFEVVKDIDNKPGFLLIKSVNNGFKPDNLASLKRSIARIKELEPGMIGDIHDFGVRIVSADIDDENFFENHSGYGGTYKKRSFGWTVLLNSANIDNTIGMYTDLQTMAGLYMESAACHDADFSTDGIYTTAPDRLNDKIGTDKSMRGMRITDDWLKPVEIALFKGICETAFEYYKTHDF